MQWNYLATALLSIQSISVFQYKNYLQQSWTFPERVTGITGRNGTGKTNLLDAIYFLCFTKSYFQKSDALLVHQGAQGMRVAGEFLKDGNPYLISGVIRETGKKEFRVNDQLCDRMADHIGNFPAVMVAPDDVQIITNGSEERRRFMDAIFSQIDHQYLMQLIQYNRILLQRNSLLKQMSEQRQRSADLLEVLDQQLIGPATYVFSKRKEYLDKLLILINNRYNNIAGENYNLQLRYDSSLMEKSFPELLQQNRERDMQSQRTQSGIHRDDINISLNDQPFRQIASQGQRKSLLFAFKLAEFALLKEAKGFAPILLLDDVFEKLDNTRMQNLLYEVCLVNQGQVLVTDTHPERIKDSFSSLGLQYGSIITTR
ncbi:DNA replication/repair protein RecF [Flavihumibacter profundi]|uniref:DNA replication/repair protein RecF n=1 Tax=Flavihumibacter profundi TaxID=2716883 RepID=UPI001CC7C686|nr:DNA replication and repair protein RecF [Flavihumibacter profundi]MBZ5856162.1 DNA replication and repair protein RecF [Flavihumibacter profundi]